MISAINPFTERSRGNRYWLTATWFIAGAVVGGAVLGGLAAIGAMLWSPFAGFGRLAAGLAVGCCLTALVSDSSMFSLRAYRVIHGRSTSCGSAAIAAGCTRPDSELQIGTGFATYIMTAAVYLTVALAVLSGSPMLALLVGLTFGLVRGSAVLLSSRARQPAELRRLHERLDRFAPLSLHAAMLVEASAALVFGFVAFGWAGLLVVAIVLVGGMVVGRLRAPRSSDAPSMRLTHAQ